MNIGPYREGDAEARGMPELFVEASETARPLFAAKGFRVAEPREFRLRGVPTHNYAVHKTLPTRA